ncbi:MAG: ABC transporter ATP-binding protein [Candidatus Binatia bacterium]|nr:ABC transporter ATP-binding protein [Candidatus Binatia bacterium]
MGTASSVAPVAAAVKPAAELDSTAPLAERSREVALRVEGLRKSYGSVVAVQGLSFEICRGEVFGLLGPNGAGKTTTISMIATQLRPTAGDAFVFGHSVRNETRRVRALIGMVPQDVSLYPQLTARENIKFFGRMYGVPKAKLEQRVQELLELVGLENRQDEPVQEFSGGMKRRLNLAVSLVHEPKLVLLDEPTVGVDPHSREKIFSIVRSLREAGTAILYTTHYMEEAERLCDRIGIMDEGKIIAMGPLMTLLSDAGCSEVIHVRGLPRAFDCSALQSVPGVCHLEEFDGGARLFVSKAVHALPALHHCLQPFAERVMLEIAPLSLEDLFLQLTGKELRD